MAASALKAAARSARFGESSSASSSSSSSFSTPSIDSDVSMQTAKAGKRKRGFNVCFCFFFLCWCSLRFCWLWKIPLASSGSSAALDSMGGDDVEVSFAQEPVVGLCTDLEKGYLRLTSVHAGLNLSHSHLIVVHTGPWPSTSAPRAYPAPVTASCEAKVEKRERLLLCEWPAEEHSSGFAGFVVLLLGWFLSCSLERIMVRCNTFVTSSLWKCTKRMPESIWRMFFFHLTVCVFLSLSHTHTHTHTVMLARYASV